MHWQVRFFPPGGERQSPFDYIRDLESASERAQIAHRLEHLQRTELADWPHIWIHKIDDKIFQLTAGQSRLMYILDGDTIVILHACKKAAQKTRKKDIARAQRHYERYMARRE